VFTSVDPLLTEYMTAMKVVGHLKEYFGGHTAHPSTGGTMRSGLEQHKIIGRFADFAASRQSSSTCTDYGDINAFLFAHSP
jgi:hypothetical protein